MALNISINVGVATAFNSAVKSDIDNRIELGDRVAPGAAAANGSDLEGDFGAGPLGAVATPPGGRSDTPGASSGRQRHLASLQPSDSTAPTPAPAASPEIHSAPRGPSMSVDAALHAASAASGVDVNTLRGISSIESSMTPGSNRNRRTQYKGLFQLNQSEFNRYGGGDIYNAHDNAMAAGRKLADDRAWFKARFHREPSDADLYMIHQQGRGFFTRGAMTNIGGNRYPGMRGPQSPASFEAGWGRELQRREDAFRHAHVDIGKPVAQKMNALRTINRANHPFDASRLPKDDPAAAWGVLHRYFESNERGTPEQNAVQSGVGGESTYDYLKGVERQIEQNAKSGHDPASDWQDTIKKNGHEI